MVLESPGVFLFLNRTAQCCLPTKGFHWPIMEVVWLLGALVILEDTTATGSLYSVLLRAGQIVIRLFKRVTFFRAYPGSKEG